VSLLPFILGVLMGAGGIVALAAVVAKRRQPPARTGPTTQERLTAALDTLRLISSHGDKQSARLARKALEADARHAPPTGSP